MKVVVSGGSGFLGRPCIETLLQRGHQVLCLSRSPSPNPEVDGLRWHLADLNSPSSYRSAIETFQPQAALHLAWEGIPDYSLENSLRNIQSGALFSEVLLQTGCTRLVVSGSCWEYGKLLGALREDMEPANPSVFGAAKNAQRLLLLALAQAANASLAWGRVFFSYGPRQKEASLVPSICRAILAGQPPALRTPGVVSDFISIEDVASALVLLTEEKASGVFNVGSGQGTSAASVADLLLEIAGLPPVFAQAESAKGSVNGFYADISAMNNLGWRPLIGLEEGLRRAFEWNALSTHR
jgi:UDP-glucose 4-epimerase